MTLHQQTDNRYHRLLSGLGRGMLLLLLSALTLFAHAQEREKMPFYRGLVIEANGFAGKQLKIYPGYPDTRVTSYAEIYAGFKLAGTKPWHQSFRYPQVGVAFVYGMLGNPDVLGHNFSLVPGITFESRDDRKVPVDLRLGTGLAWFSKPYDRLENPENMVIGSHVTNITCISASYRKNINRYFALWAGLSFVHFSNGHYQLPNVGMNTFAVNAGVKWYPYGKPELRRTEESELAVDHRVKANIRLGFGVNEFGSATKPIGGPRYPVYVVNAYASKRVGRVSNLHAGVFLTYYTGFHDFIINQNYYSRGKFIKAGVVSLFIGHEFMFGRFGLVWQSGINVYNPFQREYFRMTYGSGTTAKIKTWWCNKIGTQFYLLKPEREGRFNLWIGAYIKSNLMTADFVESSVGFCF